MVEWEADAKRNQRNEDADFWRRQREERRIIEQDEREAIAAFWMAYRKELIRIREESGPSKLNFGFL